MRDSGASEPRDLVPVVETPTNELGDTLSEWEMPADWQRRFKKINK